MSLASRTQTSARPAQVPFGSTISLRGRALQGTSFSRVTARATFQVVAKQNSLKRIKTNERNRQQNKSRKSAITTRMRKVVKAVEEQMMDLPTSEDAIKPIEKLISEAYQEIDKAVGKGALHLNTGARRKAKLAAAKKHLLVTAGLYTPQ